MSDVSRERLEELVGVARAAREGAYAPYSGFFVGSAILSDDGRVFLGANVENASYGLSMYAERTTVFHAVAQGVRRITAVAVSASGEAIAWPCGGCRQVLHEFAADAVVVSEAPDGRREERSMRDLLPDAFGPDDLS